MCVGAGAGAGDMVTAAVSAETPAGQSGGGAQSCFVIHGLFEIFWLFARKQRKREVCEMPWLPGEAVELGAAQGEQAQSVFAPHGDLKLDVGNRRAVVFWVVLPSLAGGRALLMPASQQGLREESGHDKYCGAGMSERGRGTSPCPLVLLPLTAQMVMSQPHLPSLSEDN